MLKTRVNCKRQMWNVRFDMATIDNLRKQLKHGELRRKGVAKVSVQLA